uniref:Uncharacterized protein n=1 Tax=Arundo donax TaxID=35708 RepID=A0A0A9B0G9_ARUDO
MLSLSVILTDAAKLNSMDLLLSYELI